VECWAAGCEHKSIYEPLESGGIPIVRLPFRGGYRHVLEGGRVLRGLIRVMRRHRFDLLHARSNEGGVFGRMAALATGVPAVYNPGCWTFDPASGAEWIACSRHARVPSSACPSRSGALRSSTALVGRAPFTSCECSGFLRPRSGARPGA
jgi:hypothetical protein